MQLHFSVSGLCLCLCLSLSLSVSLCLSLSLSRLILTEFIFMAGILGVACIAQCALLVEEDRRRAHAKLPTDASPPSGAEE